MSRRRLWLAISSRFIASGPGRLANGPPGQGSAMDPTYVHRSRRAVDGLARRCRERGHAHADRHRDARLDRQLCGRRISLRHGRQGRRPPAAPARQSEGYPSPPPRTSSSADRSACGPRPSARDGKALRRAERARPHKGGPAVSGASVRARCVGDTSCEPSQSWRPLHSWLGASVSPWAWAAPSSPTTLSGRALLNPARQALLSDPRAASTSWFFRAFSNPRDPRPVARETVRA